MYEIRRAAVVGAGTMGLGIAGQLANAGIRVLLLDLPGRKEAKRIERQYIRKYKELNGRNPRGNKED